MAVDVYAALKSLIDSILSDREAAARYAEDPYGTLTEYGLADASLPGVDVRNLVSDSAAGQDLPESARNVLNSYTSAAPAPVSYPVKVPPAAPAQQPADVVQHLNYVTYATYEGDEYVTQQITNQELYDYSTNIDNSTNVDIDGNVAGDITVTSTNVNATGDGAVANAGDGDVLAATGDGAQVIGGDNTGQANTGDGAVLAGRDAEGVNTGINSGIVAGGDVENAVIGDGNTVLTDVDGNVNFGGTQTNVQNSDLDNVAFGGGDVTDIDINANDGSAVAFGKGSTATGENTEIDIENRDGIVQVAGDDATQKADQSLNVEIDVEIEDSFNTENNFAQQQEAFAPPVQEKAELIETEVEAGA